jgi:ribosomal protein L34
MRTKEGSAICAGRRTRRRIEELVLDKDAR